MVNSQGEVSGDALSPVCFGSSAHIVGYGVDTLLLNVLYADVTGKPVKQELDERYVTVLNEWQEKAKVAEEPVVIPLSFRGVSFLMHPHGAGKGQWRWLLTSSLLTLTTSRGRLNGIVAQVRLSSEYLWSCESFAEAVVEVTFFLYQFFGDHLFIQVSEVHLCADVVGWEVSSCDWQSSFLSRARPRVDRAETSDETVAGGAAVAVVSGRRLATLEFGARGPLSCSIYNKTLEIKQKSRKTWFYDFWRKHGWDGESKVWRVEFRYRREALHEMRVPGVFEGIEDVLHWLRDLTPCILRADASAFVEEVYRKRLVYGLDVAEEVVL